jgi:HEAT repeat protein
VSGSLSLVGAGAIVLVVIAVVQAAFLVLLVTFLTVRRAYDRRQRAAFLAARAGLDAPLRAWLVAGAHCEPVVRALRTLPRGTAVGYTSLLARQVIPAEQRAELAVALRGEPWIALAVAQASSRLWWKRLEAARALSLVAHGSDREAVRRLLADPHPAVQVAAATALPHVADPALVAELLDRLPTLPKVVRNYLPSVLRTMRAAGGPALAERIRTGIGRSALAAWIELADAIDDAEAVGAALDRADHPAPAVRRSIAKALRRRPGPRTVEVLARLVRDPDATVRAAAARTTGEVGGSDGIRALEPLLGDAAWPVRLRAAIALAQGGEVGRTILRRAREGTDRFAREMSAMVSGLSEGALVELGD